MDLHKFALSKYVAKIPKLRSKSGVNMVNATFAYSFKCKCRIYHLCPKLTPQVLNFCYIFTMRKFVQINKSTTIFYGLCSLRP